MGYIDRGWYFVDEHKVPLQIKHNDEVIGLPFLHLW
jgi:hypothetical protein